MRGYANERGLSSLVEGGFPSSRRDTGSVPFAAASLAPGRGRGFAAGRTRLSAARRSLDGIGGLGWSVIGFLLGAVFWHFVGFWSFVSEVVLARHSTAPAERLQPVAAQLDSTKTSPLAAGWCTALHLDRKTGATSAATCVRNHPPASSQGVKPREDRAAVADGQSAWAAPSPPARAIGPVRP